MWVTDRLMGCILNKIAERFVLVMAGTALVEVLPDLQKSTFDLSAG